MKEYGGSEEKNDEKSRGAKAGTTKCWLSCVHFSDPGVKLSLFHSHSQTRVCHKQPTYKVLCFITHLYNYTLRV